MRLVPKLRIVIVGLYSASTKNIGSWPEIREDVFKFLSIRYSETDGRKSEVQFKVGGSDHALGRIPTK
jgi:hypothetical protein